MIIQSSLHRSIARGSVKSIRVAHTVGTLSAGLARLAAACRRKEPVRSRSTLLRVPLRTFAYPCRLLPRPNPLSEVPDSCQGAFHSQAIASELADPLLHPVQSMDFLKLAVASAISKGPPFPYTFGDRVDLEQSIWTLHNGTKRVC